ncbi:PREDICTED: heavy metal-associated isoprenylated plant protein 4 isoform X2 [Ipomoea nil]|uniref:heavy metal-associated isoprenylated plant protein 4 isoform X2 n=1 Tax=Ipomoea nil TaxID=35883 RepID=UPI000901A862|nr:PREDICTED: heavy metal-associated isoprenylated plant protein 4 isoform X2 [Ipomoea nil]
MGKEEEKKIEVITAVYRVRLHCPQCAHDIRKPLLRTPGVRTVDVKFEKDEVKVTGGIDAKIIHQRLEKWSKKKVEIVSQDKIKEVEKEIEVKKSIKTITLKVFMHCNKCEGDLKRKLLYHKGIHNVKTDFKSQTITVETVAESEKIASYVRKALGKHVEIVTAKKEEEKKEKVIVKEKTEKVVVETKSGEKIEEFKEVNKVEVKVKEGGGAPYFIHYVYAPQWFSDENPNACLIM